MDENLKMFAMVATCVGLGQLLLFWVTRRSKKADTRNEQELALEQSFLAERRELLTSLRAQLSATQTALAASEREKIGLMQQIIGLQKAGNEVVAKYDFLRNLNPHANLPAISIDMTGCAQPAPATQPEGGNDHA